MAGPAVSGEPAGGAAERVPAAVQRVPGAAAQTARRGGRAAGRAQDKQGPAGAHTYIHTHTYLHTYIHDKRTYLQRKSRVEPTRRPSSDDTTPLPAICKAAGVAGSTV